MSDPLPTRLRALAARREQAMRNMGPLLDREQIARDVADLREAANAQEWRPIATASKDGVEFDGWHPQLERIPDVSWDDERVPEPGWMRRVSTDSCTTWDPIDDLVLWLPAPPLPVTP